METFGTETSAARGQFRPGAPIILETLTARRAGFYHGGGVASYGRGREGARTTAGVDVSGTPVARHPAGRGGAGGRQRLRRDRADRRRQVRIGQGFGPPARGPAAALLLVPADALRLHT